MAYVWQRWLATELRAAGLEVREVAGWQNRGRPASSGSFDPRGIAVHHVGATTSERNPTAGLQLLVDGRPDLPGPIAHLGTDYLGRVWVVAAGRANVNGRNRGVPGFPERDGNAVLLGNEVMTDGTQPLPPAQRRAVALVNKVVLARYDRPVSHVVRHADISTTGKWDLGQLTTAQLRADVSTSTPTVPAPQEEHVPRLIHDPTRGHAVTDGLRFAPVSAELVPTMLGLCGQDKPQPVSTRGYDLLRQQTLDAELAYAELSAERTTRWLNNPNPPYNSGGTNIDALARHALTEAVANTRALLKVGGADVDEAEVARLVLAGLSPDAIADAIPATVARDVADLIGSRLAPEGRGV